MEWLKTKDVCMLLKLSKTRVCELVRLKKIKAVKIGNCYRYKKEDVERYMGGA